MFKIGDYIVYKRDVCKVINLKNNHLNATDYYILQPIDDASLIIEVPTTNTLGHLRPIISSKEALILIDKIPEIPLITSNDRLIENEYKSLIKSDNHIDLIKIIKTTYLRNDERIKNKKKISDKDDHYFKRAEKYLYNELSISLGMTFEEVRNYIIDKMSVAK